MNSDATEAALGLLGLSPLNAPQSHPQPQPQPQPHLHHHVVHPHGPSLTSSTVGIAVDRTSAPPVFQSALPPSLVPLKRKQPSPALSSPTTTPLASSFPKDGLSVRPRQSPHPLAASLTPPISPNLPLPAVCTKSLSVPSQRQPQQRPFSPILSGSVPPQTPPTSQISLASPSTSQHPLALSDVPPPPDSDAISCICGFTYDDGFSIACDDCSRWCHAACFGIVQGGEVPEVWKCWVCDPALVVDKERAVKAQKGRLKAMRTKASHGPNGGAPGANGVNGTSVVDDGSGGVAKPASRRRASPGAERKSRRGSAVAAAIEGSGSSRKKRRASMLSPTNPPSTSITQPHDSRISHPNGIGSAVPSNLPPTPVTFPPDIYPNPAVYAQLLRVAKAWRGVTALNPPLPFIHPPPNTYNDGGYVKVDSQGYQDRYGYSMSPLDNTTPVIMDENTEDGFVPRTILRTDPSMSCPNLASTTCAPVHLRPPSPRLHVASDPSPFPHTSIYPSPPISNYVSTPVPSSSQPRSYVKSPLTPSTNTISSFNPNDRIPAATLLAPYTATIIPSATYLADPLNGYAHLGMGKPQVRLVGGGWEVGLDARGVGGVPDPPDSAEKGNGVSPAKEDAADGKTKWARCGCWPNAVVRPVICNGKTGRGCKKRMRHKAECAKATSEDSTCEADMPPQLVNGASAPPPSRMPGQHDTSGQDDSSSMSDSEADPTSLSFALFALRDLRADEEIVLGWEWDDGHAVHMLPALMESPGLFAPAHLQHLRAQFTSILHALSSTFTTCACGSSTRDCAVRVMEQVVEGRWPWPGGEMTPEGSEGESSDVNCVSEDWDDVEVEVDVEGDGQPDSRPNRNWGLGVNVDVDIEMDAAIEVDGRTRRVKKRKVRKKSLVEDPAHVNGASGTVPPSRNSKAKKAIDLGPLVGIKRGFRTREKIPMNGGWGGVEIVASSLTAPPEVRVEENSHVGGKGKGKARADDMDGTDVAASPDTLPPRMRKAWSRHPGPMEPSQENLPQDHSVATENWKAHERWRSPPDANAESPISVCGAGGSSGGKGSCRKQGPNGDGEDGADGQETDFDTETEGDGSDDTRQMPPPPMPASLDPTTISSLAHAHAVRSASPRGSILWDNNNVAASWIPPQTSASTSASSGRSSEIPSQGTAINSTGSLVSPARFGALSPSTPFSPATPVHSQPLPLVPGVSPSTPFSKLSLHSPDASSAPGLSVLYSPNELTPASSSASALTRHSDNHASSPSHTPSKPLHVHPQNEPPSLPASLSVPVATLRPPDGTRDAPAEAQYQQPYRCSPESRCETHRPTNGDVYRVRFASPSPEVLSGMPRLKERASDLSEPFDAGGVRGNATETLEKACLLSCDAMDVEVDIIGGDRAEGGSGVSHATSPENSNNGVEVHEHLSTHASESPSSQALPDPRPLSIVSAEDETVPAIDSSATASDVNEMTSQAEPMAIDSDPPRPPREPSPPPPKVKMSFKDFVLRKKKQREEEMAKSLVSPATPDGPALPPSPNVDVKRELASEHVGAQTSDSVKAVNVPDVKMTDALKVDVLDQPETMHVTTNGFDGGMGGVRHPDERITAEANKRQSVSQAPATVQATKSPDTPQSGSKHPADSSIIMSRVSDERNNLDETQPQNDGKPGTTLVAKMEVMEVMVPSGLVGTDDLAPDVVSFAPEPPPPPLMTKQASEMTIDRTGSTPRSVPPLIPASASTPTSMSTSTSTSAVNSRSNSVGISGCTPTPSLLQHAHAPASSSNVPSSRRPSHEDGEITNSTPPKSYLPRSHTPPTQPRSFHSVHPSSPSFGTTSTSTIPAARRTTPSLSRSPLSSNAVPTPAPITSRPLPSGPRALRGSVAQPTHPYVPPRPSYGGSQYIPRGPSADRDWERSDRQWTAQPRSRGRAGSNGWGR